MPVGSVLAAPCLGGKGCPALRPCGGAVPGAEGRDTGTCSFTWDFSVSAAS